MTKIHHQKDGMLSRILEPEVMDTEREAIDYDAMDHAEVNRLFVGEFLDFADFRSAASFSVLDVGTGTAQIPIELCRRHSACQITAIDLSREMLKVGEKNVAAAGFSERIDLQFLDAKRLPFDDAGYDAVISNSIIHHIPEPSAVVGEMARVLKPGGLLFVRDLLRPSDAGMLDHLVQTYAGRENEHQRKMFRDSLHAALTVEEVRELLAGHDLPSDWVKPTSDRHWTIAGGIPI